MLEYNAARVLMTPYFDPLSSPSSSLRETFHNRLNAVAQAHSSALPSALQALVNTSAQWRVSHPMNQAHGIEAALAVIYQPLKKSFPDLERRDVIFTAGSFNGHVHVAALGHYYGTMRGDWLGIPATNKTITIRYGEVYQLDGDGKVVQATLLWDVLDVMRQAGVWKASGWPLAPPLGNDELWPAPLTVDGIRLTPSDPVESQASITQTLAMHRTLFEHDDRKNLSRDSLIGMPQREHWHPKMMWYGPAGIGATRGLDGFVDGHQLPFRIAFHRPQGSFEEVSAERKRHGVVHYIQIGDGPYSVTGGWPSVYAMHNGGGFCGLPPTGRPVFMRVMDFYMHHEGRIRENWVPLDMLDLLNQMGFDALARMQEVLRR